MTLAFRVRDIKMFDQVKAGDRVGFTAGRTDGQITVTKLERAAN